MPDIVQYVLYMLISFTLHKKRSNMVDMVIIPISEKETLVRERK